MGYLRFRSFTMGISYVVYCFLVSFNILFLSDGGLHYSNHGFASRLFCNKRYVTPNINFVNVRDLNKVLRSEVFVSDDRQLRAVHLILDFQPLSDKFQDMGHAIKKTLCKLTCLLIALPTKRRF